MTTLSFDDLRIANRDRCEQAYHSIDSWSPSDWGNAMAGEFGEVAVEFLDLQTLMIKLTTKIQACDTIKKMMRQLESDAEVSVLKDKLALELADIVIYCDLLSERVGIDLGESVVKKFNQNSDKMGSDIYLKAS